MLASSGLPPDVEHLSSSEVRMNLHSLVPITAVINSNFGKVNSLMGATRVVDMISEGCSSWQIYATALVLCTFTE